MFYLIMAVNSRSAVGVPTLHKFESIQAMKSHVIEVLGAGYLAEKLNKVGDFAVNTNGNYTLYLVNCENESTA